MARCLSQDWEWYVLLIPTESGTVIEETNVQHVTRDDMIDDQTVSQYENNNTDINERLDETKIWIQHREGRITLEDEYDLQQIDEAYRNNDPT